MDSDIVLLNDDGRQIKADIILKHHENNNDYIVFLEKDTNDLLCAKYKVIDGKDIILNSNLTDEEFDMIDKLLESLGE